MAMDFGGILACAGWIGSDTIAPMDDLEPQTLDLVRRSAEVEIETRMSADEPVHRTVIWVVVDEAGRVLARSYRGAQARWYREALASGTVSASPGAAPGTGRTRAGRRTFQRG